MPNYNEWSLLPKKLYKQSKESQHLNHSKTCKKKSSKMHNLLQSQRELSNHTIHQNLPSLSIWRKSQIQSTISWRMKITWQAWAWTKSRSLSQLQSLLLRKFRSQNHNLRVNLPLRRLSKCLKESLNPSLNLNLRGQSLRSHFQEKKSDAKKKLKGLRKSNLSSNF